MSSADDYKFSDQVGFLLRRAYQRHAAIFKETVPDSQLSAAQFVVLCVVRERQSCQVDDIVRETAIDEPTVRGIVEHLKWRNLVAVAHEPGDARQVVVALTPAGAAMVEQIVPFARQISELTFGELSAAERTALVELLRKISGLDAESAG
ncbi:MAG: MarR family winged helix-turn-helix transcriptional regulator [Pseudomonadota bacterium]|jgi:DNA-binding MarR family transcriptional regulator